MRHTAISLTCKIGAAGSRRAGEIMVAVFFGRCAVCVVVVCGSRVRYDSISIRWFFVVFFLFENEGA